ncbi:FAD-dependent oxidoreductase [Nocardia sp. IBHARD005]|uniref:FAD-dependent oxidoreductase n=1 Tax=Nocardia sp. IBHARD005 TaxID=3457765 RepID=UPI00405918C0
MPTAIVVGGGIGGVAAALALAGRGWSVEVLERHRRSRRSDRGFRCGPTPYVHWISSVSVLRCVRRQWRRCRPGFGMTVGDGSRAPT